MKTTFAALALAVAALSPAHAGDYADIKKLAEASDLSVRKVQMVLGTRTAFAEYPYTYQRSLEKLQVAIGKENYQRLMAGQAIELEDGEVVGPFRVAAVDAD
jgi:hypothetical protein